MSKDWHPANHTSFASNHTNKKPFEQHTIIIDDTSYLQTLWPDHCVQNTPGAMFAPSLQVPQNAVTILKGMDPRYDSYSAFFDNARRAQTSLLQLLKKANVRTLYVCGLALDVCVLFTVMDALDLGFTTVLLLDACVRCTEMFTSEAFSPCQRATHGNLTNLLHRSNNLCLRSS